MRHVDFINSICLFLKRHIFALQMRYALPCKTFWNYSTTSQQRHISLVWHIERSISSSIKNISRRSAYFKAARTFFVIISTSSALLQLQLACSP